MLALESGETLALEAGNGDIVKRFTDVSPNYF